MSTVDTKMTAKMAEHVAKQAPVGEDGRRDLLALVAHQRQILTEKKKLERTVQAGLLPSPKSKK